MCKALTLILLIGFLAFADHPICAQNSEPETHQQESPTEEEVREARELVGRFAAQIEQKQDATGLIDELFVRDFVQRLRTDPRPLVLFEIDKDVFAAASNEQLRRSYVNNLNTLYIAMRVYVAAEINRRNRSKPDALKDEAGFDPTFADIEAVVPRELFELLSNDPIWGTAFSKTIQEERQTGSKAENDQQNGQSNSIQSDNAQPYNDADEEHTLWGIFSIERLDRLNDLMEKAAVIVRKKLKEMPPDLAPDLKSACRIFAPKDEPPTEEPIVIVRDDNFMGYPPHTRFISTNILFLHIDMIRDYDGQLRIAAAHFIDD